MTVKSAVHSISCGIRNSPKGTAKNRKASGNAMLRAARDAQHRRHGQHQHRHERELRNRVDGPKLAQQPPEARRSDRRQRPTSSAAARPAQKPSRARQTSQQRNRRHEESVRKRVRARPDRRPSPRRCANSHTTIHASANASAADAICHVAARDARSASIAGTRTFVNRIAHHDSGARASDGRRDGWPSSRHPGCGR